MWTLPEPTWPIWRRRLPGPAPRPQAKQKANTPEHTAQRQNAGAIAPAFRLVDRALGDRTSLQQFDAGGDHALLPLTRRDTDALVRFERIDADPLQHAARHEHVRAAVVGSDEAIAFFSVEELYGAVKNG